MPLSAATLSAAIKTEIENIAGIDIIDEAELERFTDALATAIVDHITANALVTGTVTSGAGAGGAVTGTVS